MSENYLLHKAKCRSNIESFYNHHVAEVHLGQFCWTDIIRQDMLFAGLHK